MIGKRDDLSNAANEAMNISGLAHILSISGWHMVMVAGIVFFLVRAGFAILPGMALQHDLKRWAAAAALGVTTLYLAFSGMELPTRRSWIMIAVVLLGVIFKRPAFSLRSLSLAALVLLMFQPEALVHPSFQMSFSATLALVVAFQGGLIMPRPVKDSHWLVMAAGIGLVELLAAASASFVAGLATTPFVAWHFHRASMWSVLANVLAGPLSSLWIMPVAMLALILQPFGWDGAVWPIAGQGVSALLMLAQWVSALPWAQLPIAAFPATHILLFTAGFLLLALLHSRLRWLGAIPIVLACLLALRAPQPEVLISADGKSIAVRDQTGELVAFGSKPDRFIMRSWQEADGRRDGGQGSEAFRSSDACDLLGCAVTTINRRSVILAHRRDAVLEECGRADLIIAPGVSEMLCPGQIGRADIVGTGAMAFYSESQEGWRQEGGRQEGWRIEYARAPNAQRPWHPPEIRPSARKRSEPENHLSTEPTDPENE